MCFSSSGSEHFNIRKIQSQLSQQCSFIHPKLSLFFHPPTLVSPRTRISLSSIHLIDVKSLHSSPSMFLPGDAHEDFNKVSSSPLFILFLLRWNQFKLSVLIIFFSVFQCFLMPVQFLIVHLSLFYCSGVLKISQKIRVPTLNPFKLF